MTSSNKDFESFAFFADTRSEGLTVDYKRIIYQILRYWYIIVISVVTALIIAFLVNRYSQRVYPVTASVIVKEAEDVSGAELLYNNPLVNFRRNYLNEIYILKSYPLMQQVIEDLNYDVSFFRQGSILTTEVLDEDFPIEATANRDKSTRPVSFQITVLNVNEYELEAMEDEDVPNARFRFGDNIKFNDFYGLIKVSDSIAVKQFLNIPLIFSYTPSMVLAGKYVSRVKAQWAEEGAGVILLSLEGTSPKKEIRFLNSLITHYQNNDLNSKNQTATRTVDFITSQLEDIRDSLRLAEAQLESFKEKNVAINLNEEALRLYTKIENLEVEKAQILISRNYYKYLIDYIQRNQNLHQIILPSSIGITDPILSGLISQMAQLQMDVKMASGKAENPLVTEGIKKIDEIKKDIIESVKNQQSTDKIRIDFIENQISEIEKQLRHLPVAQRNLVSIQRNYTLLENLYILLLQKRSEAAISRASNTSDIVIVNHPMSGIATSPKGMLNYILALALGLFLPIISFVIIEMFDTRVQSKEDIEKLTGIPFIGGVGHKTSNNNLAVFHQPKSALAESFRALRSNLNFFLTNQNKSIFLITSSISGEGKSFTSINLASVLSMSGKKTLIVGADLRKPKMYTDFNLSNEKGLSSYLAGMVGFEEIIQNTAFENLNFVAGGPVPPNPSELLLSSRMNEFIELAKQHFDYVVIDTPPLAVVTDAFVLSRFADHIVFLVRQNYTPKSLLRTAQESYAAGKLANISIVLNDIYKSGPGYGYGYSYGYGYGYGYAIGKKNGKENGYYEG